MTDFNMFDLVDIFLKYLKFILITTVIASLIPIYILYNKFSSNEVTLVFDYSFIPIFKYDLRTYNQSIEKLRNGPQIDFFNKDKQNKLQANIFFLQPNTKYDKLNDPTFIDVILFKKITENYVSSVNLFDNISVNTNFPKGNQNKSIDTFGFQISKNIKDSDLDEIKSKANLLTKDINRYMQQEILTIIDKAIYINDVIRQNLIQQIDKSNKVMVYSYNSKILLTLSKLSEQAIIAKKIGLKKPFNFDSTNKNISSLSIEQLSDINQNQNLFYIGYEALEGLIQTIKDRTNAESFIPEYQFYNLIKKNIEKGYFKNLILDNLKSTSIHNDEFQLFILDKIHEIKSGISFYQFLIYSITVFIFSLFFSFVIYIFLYLYKSR